MTVQLVTVGSNLKVHPQRARNKLWSIYTMDHCAAPESKMETACHPQIQSNHQIDFCEQAGAGRVCMLCLRLCESEGKWKVHSLLCVLRVSGGSHKIGDWGACKFGGGAWELFTGDPSYLLSADSCDYVTFQKLKMNTIK